MLWPCVIEISLRPARSCWLDQFPRDGSAGARSAAMALLVGGPARSPALTVGCCMLSSRGSGAVVSGPAGQARRRDCRLRVEPAGVGKSVFGAPCARAASGAHTQFLLQLRKAAAAFANSAVDVSIGDAVANANDHRVRSRSWLMTRM